MYKWLFTILYGLLTIWIGLWRNIEAGAYKPNALWFCMTMGLVALAAGFLYRLEMRRTAGMIAGIAAVIVFGFYFFVFVTQPEKDATFRVGLIILASIAEMVVVLLPGSRGGGEEAPGA